MSMVLFLAVALGVGTVLGARRARNKRYHDSRNRLRQLRELEAQQQASRQFMLDRLTQSSTPPLVSLTPTPDADADQQLPEIEVGRYALRTFFLSHGKLGSLTRADFWKNGVAIAQCDLPRCNPVGPIISSHSAPQEHCSCGLYGTLTLDQLILEYKYHAQRCVAVFAAEGTTFIGSKGLRTAAARVVAYWCSEVDRKDFFAEQCPEATYFSDVHAMLAEYGFPASTVEWPPLIPIPSPEYLPVTATTTTVVFPPTFQSRAYGFGFHPLGTLGSITTRFSITTSRSPKTDEGSGDDTA